MLVLVYSDIRDFYVKLGSLFTYRIVVFPASSTAGQTVLCGWPALCMCDAL